jgi:hypothetical protein
MISCPYLQRGTRVLVYLERPDTEVFVPPVPVPVGLSSLDLAPAVGGWSSVPSIVDARASIARSRLGPFSIFPSTSGVTHPDIVSEDFFGAVPLVCVAEPLVLERQTRRNGELEAPVEAPVEGLSVMSSSLEERRSSSSGGDSQRARRHESPPEDFSSRDEKRPRLDERSARDSLSPSSPTYSPTSSPGNPEVSRRERGVLLKIFRKEQRMNRKQYRASLRSKWDVEVADDKENAQGKEQETTSPVDPEVEAEAFENYLFDRMATYDEDSAHQLAHFWSSLRIVPEQLGGPSPVLRQERTEALWAGLCRVYFDEQEREPVAELPALSHEEIMGNLRREIAELEERAAVQSLEIA